MNKIVSLTLLIVCTSFYESHTILLKSKKSETIKNSIYLRNGKVYETHLQPGDIYGIRRINNPTSEQMKEARKNEQESIGVPKMRSHLNHSNNKTK